MVRALVAAAASASMLAAAAAAAATGGVWSSNGPPGASVYCISPAPSSPSTVYVGTGRGVWRGERGGAVWQSASAGLPVDRVQAIAVDPTNASTLYAGTVTPSDGTPSVGIFKSVDGGASWSESNGGLVDPVTLLEPLDVAALSIDPSSPQVILAGTRFSEIFRSTDGGATWTPRTLGGFGLGLETTGFARDPGDPQRVYAVSTRGFLLSTNGGESWGFFGNAGISFYTIAVDPSTPSTVYAGNVTGFGLARSTDSGATWSTANGNLPRYSSGGASYFPAVLFVAGTGGVFVSSDGGVTWSALGTGLSTFSVRSLALDASRQKLYAGLLRGGVASLALETPERAGPQPTSSERQTHVPPR